MRISLPSRARTVLALFGLILLTFVVPGPARADNPIVQTVYTADPAPLVHNGRVYLYTGRDEDNSTYFTMKEWRVWSSADMVNWTDHGSPLNLASFTWADQNAWAGQAIERNGKFYWYVPMRVRATGRMAVGVAVSDNGPTGPFRDAIGRPLVDTNEIDPSVMIDSDGQAYLYWGNPNLWYVKLNADMISTSMNPTKITLTTAGFGTRPGGVANRPTMYEEGPWVYKRGNTYYNVYAAKCCSEDIRYSTAPGPLGPWTYRGVIMPTQGSSFTNHAGVIDFAGKSYFFYHNGALPGGGGYTRSVAVEQFSYGSDGSIPTITMSTAGAPQVGTLDPYVVQEAETIANSSGVETEAISAGGRAVSFLENGDWIKVKGAAFGTGATSFKARVASAASGGRIEVRLDSATGTLAGTCTVTGTGGWQTFTEVTCPVSASGTHDLFLRFTGGSGSLFNMDRWQFTRTGTTTSPPTTPPPSTPPPSTPPPSNPPPTGEGCSASYRTTSTWSGGFQAEVTVTAGGTALSGWRVSWTTPSGQTVNQVWSGTLTTSGTTATVSNASYNGSLAPSASTVFGLLADGTAGTAPALTCTAL
jgi:arabinoxylan arabinofuranohydrolase